MDVCKVLGKPVRIHAVRCIHMHLVLLRNFLDANDPLGLVRR